VLRALEYQITIPSAHAFLVRFLKAAHADKKMLQLSCYILLQNYSLLEYLPSQMAVAVIFLARRAAGRNSWIPILLEYAQYCEEVISLIARAILEGKNNASSELRAVTKKYSSARYGRVANTILDSDFKKYSVKGSEYLMTIKTHEKGKLLWKRVSLPVV